MPAVYETSRTEILIRRLSLLLVGAVVCQIYGCTATLVAFGNSYSDDGDGANDAVQAALGTTQVCNPHPSPAGAGPPVAILYLQ